MIGFSQSRTPSLVPPRPRGNESAAVTVSRQNATTPARATTPAKAGAQLGNAPLADAALSYLDLSNWAPASAGVVLMDGQPA